MKKIVIKVLTFCFVMLSYMSILNAQTKEPQINTSKIQVKGDTLVVMDASCDSGKSNSLISKLQKDSNKSSPQDCEIDNTQTIKNSTSKSQK